VEAVVGLGDRVGVDREIGVRDVEGGDVVGDELLCLRLRVGLAASRKREGSRIDGVREFRLVAREPSEVGDATHEEK
jgi:hypothetical protein